MIFGNPLLHVFSALGDYAGHSEGLTKVHLNPLPEGIGVSCPAAVLRCSFAGEEFCILGSMRRVIAMVAFRGNLGVMDDYLIGGWSIPDVVLTFWWGTLTEEADLVVFTGVAILVTVQAQEASLFLTILHNVITVDVAFLVVDHSALDIHYVF